MNSSDREASDLWLGFTVTMSLVLTLHPEVYWKQWFNYTAVYMAGGLYAGLVNSNCKKLLMLSFLIVFSYWIPIVILFFFTGIMIGKWAAASPFKSRFGVLGALCCTTGISFFILLFGFGRVP